ncbi:MAG: hypothetical protein ACKVOO_06455 [Burkholderiaceae bacterium]
MKTTLVAIFIVVPSWLLVAVAGGDASDGHSHDAAPAALNSPALPRFAAQSDLFEAVGVLTGAELSIFVDRFASNEPVLAAKVELESGSVKAAASFHADQGDYRTPSEPFKKPGTYPITLTITAGDQTDLLVGELVVPDPQAQSTSASAARPWFKWLGWAAGGLVLALAALLILRKLSLRRSAHAAF